MEHVSCEFSYFVDRENKLKITELVKFKTFDDFTRADQLSDNRMDELILQFKEIIDLDSITEEDLLEFNIDEE